MNDNTDFFLRQFGIGDAPEPGLGSSPNIDLYSQQASVLDLPTAFAMVAESCKRDPAMAQRLIDMIGIDKLDAAKARKAPVRMPTSRIRTIECSIAYSPSRAPAFSKDGKPRRSRPDRDKLPYFVSIQITDPNSRGLSDPAWRGAAHLRTPDRAAKDARRNNHKTSLSMDYVEWLDSIVIPIAKSDGYMVGFLMDKRKGEGTYFHEFQVILVAQDELERRALRSATILSLEADGNTRAIRLPLFSTTTGKGKPLSKCFILQSRGVRAPGERSEWAMHVGSWSECTSRPKEV
ncbi:hypothetical protein GCM10023208_25330 [Erythrobacter westpacificensis]|uniref:Uncharacterized protein n=1 Tax=Erythrobacter westpacificensis TaxID=1055231 RepID=A0ABP9KLR9_9SPHN